MIYTYGIDMAPIGTEELASAFVVDVSSGGEQLTTTTTNVAVGIYRLSFVPLVSTSVFTNTLVHVSYRSSAGATPLGPPSMLPQHVNVIAGEIDPSTCDIQCQDVLEAGDHGHCYISLFDKYGNVAGDAPGGRRLPLQLLEDEPKARLLREERDRRQQVVLEAALEREAQLVHGGLVATNGRLTRLHAQLDGLLDGDLQLSQQLLPLRRDHGRGCVEAARRRWLGMAETELACEHVAYVHVQDGRHRAQRLSSPVLRARRRWTSKSGQGRK